MSTQTPCSQFCVEPAVSVIDASAVWHGTASVPGGRFWFCYQDSKTTAQRFNMVLNAMALISRWHYALPSRTVNKATLPPSAGERAVML